MTTVSLGVGTPVGFQADEVFHVPVPPIQVFASV